MPIAIKAENLSKAYQLGQIGTGTLSRDLQRWHARIRGKEDPFLKIGETNDRTARGESDVVWSLKDVNFEIEQGDALGIIGKNGAGKSTLLKILSRVTAPTTGKITGNGRVASLLEVGTGFHPELTGRENIYLNGAILGMRKKEITRKFDEIVSFAGVERYIDTPVKRYSSGMYVRLAFAVAAHLESEILIVDEVLAVGDAEFQKKCLGKMGEVSKGEGRTVLFVSHNMGSVRKLCNKGLLLEYGKALNYGGINKVIDDYFYLTANGSRGKEEIGLLKWERNMFGRDECYLNYVRLVQKGNNVNSIDSGEPFIFEISYDVIESLKDMSISFNIVNNNDEVILHSSDIFVFGESGICPRKKGSYISCCEFPANYLNEGTYSINVMGDIPNEKIFFESNSALTFKVENISAEASKYPSHMWKGILSPESVKWQLLFNN